MSEKLNKKIILAMAGVLIAVVLLVVFVMSCGKDTGKPGAEPTQGTVAGNEPGQVDGDKTGQGNGEAGKESQDTGENGAVTDGDSTQSKPEVTPAPGTPNATPAPNGGEEGGQPQTPSIDITKADAPYEKWLAAGMILAASMQYPDFEFEAVYITGEHELTDRTSSAGAYLKIKTGGESVVLESKPLNEERSAEGTMDLYTGDLGFNTFDMIGADSLDTAELKEVSVDSLTELINQSILVTVYEH